MPDPSVALIIAAKDASATVGLAVASALRQPEAAEVVLVDDGSRDDRTVAAARAADDGSGRLKIIRLDQNVGPSAARNRAIAASSAPLIGILDADDYLEPGRLARLLALAPEGWDILADNMVFKTQGREDHPGDLLIADGVPTPFRLTPIGFILRNITDVTRPRRELGFLKPLVRRRFLLDNDLAYDETLRLGEDYILYTQSLLKGAAFWVVAACGYVAIERPDSLSGSHAGRDLAALVEADDRLIALAGGEPTVTRALLARRRNNRRRRDHAQMLEAKRERRFGAALEALLRTPDSTIHILAATVRDRLARLHR